MDDGAASGRVARTERRILDAAAELFRADGYHRTTLVSVAAAAGVSERIVYVRFGTKGALLTRVVAAAADGDPDDWFSRAITPSTSGATLSDRVEQYTAGVSAQLARVAPLMAVATQAEQDEPVVAAATALRRAATVARLTSFWRALRADRLLAPDADLDWVIATTSVFVLPETFVRMTAQQGWGPEEYAAWLHRTWTHVATVAPA